MGVWKKRKKRSDHREKKQTDTTNDSPDKTCEMTYIHFSYIFRTLCLFTLMLLSIFRGTGGCLIHNSGFLNYNILFVKVFFVCKTLRCTYVLNL